jgi:hypothetical protein
MNILFRSTKTQKYKDSDRKYLSFEPIFSDSTNSSSEINYISATANDSSIDSPLNKIINYYDYDFSKFSESCLRFNRCDDAIFIFYSPTVLKKRLPPIIFIKQTYGNLDNVAYYIGSLIYRFDQNDIHIANIHFTHYSLIFNKLPKDELKIIFEALLSRKMRVNINNFYIDIDKDYFDDAINLYKNVSGSDCVSIINT